METGSNLDTQAADLVAQRRRRADRSAGTVECGQDPVSSLLDQPTSRGLDLPNGHLVVQVQQLAPSAVAELPGAKGRIDDVGEQNRSQHPVGLGGRADPRQELLDRIEGHLRVLPHDREIDPWELDELRFRDVLCQVAAMGDGHERHVRSVQHQCRSLHEREDRSCVDVQDALSVRLDLGGRHHAPHQLGEPSTEPLIRRSAWDE